MGNQGKLRFFLKDLIAKTQWTRDLDLVTSDSFKQQNVQSPNKRQRITNTRLLVGTVSTWTIWDTIRVNLFYVKELGSLGTVTQLYSQDLVSGRRKILGAPG